jgi:hypothetical protein
MKKTISSALVLFIMLTSSVSAEAASFSDVPANSWYSSYVSRLADRGIVDSTVSTYRPADSLNRAELVKMVITMIDGLKGYTQPPTATFDDVPFSAWFSSYVETAATLDIVSGYSDAEGNLTGLFGPSDTVTRAAATKILVQAFNLESTSATPAIFKDVKADDWFKSYVDIATQNGVVSGYDNGNFGPADPVTRAQMAKMLVLGAEVAGLMEKVPPAVPPVTPVTPTPEPATPPSTLPNATANPLSIERTTAPAGSNGYFVAKYVFKALHEGFRVETVTIVNDLTGDKMGDQPASTEAVKNVILKFPNKDGKLVTESASMSSDGTVRFANLDFFAKRDSDTFFEVYADLNKISDVGDSLSGQVFRLGLKDTGNTSGSFRAVGDISGAVISGTGNSGNLMVSSSQVKYFTVRKTVPHFSLNTGSTQLSNGESSLISYDVTAAQAGSVGLARLVFDISVSDSSGANLSLKDFKLYRGSTYLTDVNVYDATGAQNLSLGSGGSLMDGISFVIVTFNQEETVSAGDSLTFSLKATVSNSEAGDSVSTRIAQGDENSPLTGLTQTGQPNTGKIFVNGDPTAGIFVGALDFFQSLSSSRAVIWSDKSSDLHQFPTVSGGVITSDSGSDDWTNGYLLNLTGLEDHTISK